MVSKSTKAIAFRLDISVWNVIYRRASKRGLKVSEYCKERTSVDATRKR